VGCGRPTAGIAAQRNYLVASLASQVFIAHAAVGSRTEAFARKLEDGKPLLTLESAANANLCQGRSKDVPAATPFSV